MPRPRKDGAPARAPRKHKLTALFVDRVRREATAFNVWDTHRESGGLVLRVQPTGQRSWKCVYRRHGRPRWYHIGKVNEIGLADARKLARRVMFAAGEGKDPAAERKAARAADSFAKLAEDYVEHAKKKNKSWRQADALVRRLLLPKWGKLKPADVTRADVKAMMGRIAAPIVANQTLAAASAIFSWAVKQEIVSVNPCKLVDRNPTRERERVLSDTEVPRFWAAFDNAGLVESAALKVILLTGQRPGEVSHMRKEHVADNWWTMPGEPVAAIGWPGTKNGHAHRVWIPAAARDVIAELTDDGTTTGFVFAGPRGRPVDGLDAAMRAACAKLKVERATPHDLRRTHGSTITALGFGREAMNRIQNHREGGIADVYDRHEYAEENKRIMEAVTARIVGLVEGRAAADNVVQAAFGQK
jgi:integrase